MIFGDAGYFYIPDANLRVPLYDKAKRKNAQDVVDAENSALLCRKFKGGHCDYIADHAHQGFKTIKKCPLGSVAYIVTPTSTQFYTCIAMMNGTNLSNNLKTLTGQKLSNIRWADLCAYCCNDDTGKNISMVFFKAGLKLPYNLFPDIKDD